MFKITFRFAVMSMINCTSYLKVGPHCVQLPHAALYIEDIVLGHCCTITFTVIISVHLCFIIPAFFTSNVIVSYMSNLNLIVLARLYNICRSENGRKRRILYCERVPRGDEVSFPKRESQRNV